MAGYGHADQSVPAAPSRVCNTRATTPVSQPCFGVPGITVPTSREVVAPTRASRALLSPFGQPINQQRSADHQHRPANHHPPTFQGDLQPKPMVGTDVRAQVVPQHDRRKAAGHPRRLAHAIPECPSRVLCLTHTRLPPPDERKSKCDQYPCTDIPADRHPPRKGGWRAGPMLCNHHAKIEHHHPKPLRPSLGRLIHHTPPPATPGSINSSPSPPCSPSSCPAHPSPRRS